MSRSVRRCGSPSASMATTLPSVTVKPPPPSRRRGRRRRRRRRPHAGGRGLGRAVAPRPAPGGVPGWRAAVSLDPLGRSHEPYDETGDFLDARHGLPRPPSWSSAPTRSGRGACASCQHATIRPVASSAPRPGCGGEPVASTPASTTTSPRARLMAQLPQVGGMPGRLPLHRHQSDRRPGRRDRPTRPRAGRAGGARRLRTAGDR